MTQRRTLALTLFLVLLPVAAAQTGARMAQRQPVLDLAQTVRLLPELEKNKATAVTKTQAKSLITILTALQKAKAVQPNDAKKYLTQIETKILTGRQLTALDSLLIEAEEERAARRAQAQSGQPQRQAGVSIPGIPGRIGAAQGQQRPGTPGTAAARSPQDDAFNPFVQGPTADRLKAYLALLRKK
ncbi:hypothetical protein L1280_001793 [Deinococcus sp. HSC-46F16]|uniref:hypothetical protein n=1 Tax=Deinococcus sp. HSC-46F16 TaxID=2910968 RepID=UPI00209E41D7|nr:hypothetical protein [Deinococcus sp. HSC-46F16]MCP2014642.1 hypothetical protein [Deinococcus sp. HSC-46F16]